MKMIQMLRVMCRYIEPPDVNELTDEDSGNDAEPESLKPASLSGNQLCA